MFKKYFSWLQKGVPTGQVEKYPELNESNETSLKGVYIAGDLTGIPLLKLAAEGGEKLVGQFLSDPNFEKERNQHKLSYDVIIIGGGPAGIAAGMACAKANLKYLILEASQCFNTIENFPKGKPILAKPDHLAGSSHLNIHDGTKESLLEELKEQSKEAELNIQTGVFVQKLSRKQGVVIETNQDTYEATRVILAIGKSGNARKLGVAGEDQEKVFDRLFDPAEFVNKEVLVVGGGDSALEASIALAKSGALVHHSYRKDQFARPKEENSIEFNSLVAEKKIKPLFSSNVKNITESAVTIDSNEGEKTINNDAVFTLIGRELPFDFFRRSKIRIQGDKDISWWVFLFTMLSFFTMLYFGKSGLAYNAFADKESIVEKIIAYFLAPVSAAQSGQGGFAYFNFLLGWIGSVVFLITGVWSFFYMLGNTEKYFKLGWPLVKYAYIILTAIFFTWLFVDANMANHQASGWIEEPTYYYSLFYCITMVLFAIRRAYVKKTRYVKWQMITLCVIQVFFLFLLPFHLYEPYIEPLAQQHAWLREVFPASEGKWTCFAFILFWPLYIGQFGTSTFWTIFPFFQSGLALFWLIKQYGKGAYCGWICSCGGMAETFGDEYRHLAPHGPKAKKYENIGQWILLFAVLVTIISFINKQNWIGGMVIVESIFKGTYKFAIDIVFAGVLGLGVYFFMGGRVWCRFGCPLAALMHIYTRFSKYRILAEKKNCISCNICTKVCHMGIDVMNYANKGVPMNDVECVRCSTCVTSCPMEVLSFAKLNEGDPENKSREQVPDYGKEDWRAAIK